MSKLWLVWLLPFFVSCASLRDVEGLDVSLVNLRLTDATFLESTGEVTIRVDNENPTPFLTSGAVHKIYLNGLYIGKGLTSQPLEIPRIGSATQTVIIHLSNLSLATRVRAILQSQVIDYRVDSMFYTETPKGMRKLHAASSGALALKDFSPTPRSPTAQ